MLLGISLIIRSSATSLPGEVKIKRIRGGIQVLTAMATVVRLEIALFLLPVVLSLVIQRRITVWKAIYYGAVAGICALGGWSHLLSPNCRGPPRGTSMRVIQHHESILDCVSYVAAIDFCT